MKRQKDRSGRIPLGVEWILMGVFAYLGVVGFFNMADEYNSKARLVRETSSQREICSSQRTGFCRAVDFDKDGLLDKIENASYSVRPYHIKWHEVNKNSLLYTQVQKEYSNLLNRGKK